MKWLILQSAGEHRGQDCWAPNWFLRECLSLQDALLRCGEICEVAGPGHGGRMWADEVSSAIQFADVVVVAENYGATWLTPLLPLIHSARTRFHWIIDLHVQTPESYTEISKACNFVLHATESLIAGYRQHAPSAKHVWFPNAVDDRYFNAKRYDPIGRDRDVVFVGGRGQGEREKILAEMERRTQLQALYGVTGYEYLTTLLKTKVGFNVPIAGDINYRTFEVPAMGAALLTKADPCLTELGFVDGDTCLTYRDVDEAVGAVRRAIGSGTWRGVADRGRRLVVERHTYFTRAKQLIALTRGV